MDEYLDVKLDIFEHIGQRARLRKSLTISGLVDEILREFNDIAADSPEKYAVYLKGTERPLTPSFTMIQLDLQPQDELVFEYVRQNIRRMLKPENYAFLRDESNQRVYDIQWQPALIGRPTNEAEHNIVLAVNLQLHPKGLTVSRKHAVITFMDGHYYIEPMADTNPVLVSDKEVPFNTRREIRHGDKITLGRNNLNMTFLTQMPVSSISNSPIRQVESQPDATFQQQFQAEAYPKPSPGQSAPGVIAGMYGSANQTARLVVEKSSTSGQEGQSMELLTFPCFVGRDTPLLSAEKDVSRQHIEITSSPTDRKFLLRDLQSTNGVFLDGNRIEQNKYYELRSGVRVGMGANVVLRFDVS